MAPREIAEILKSKTWAVAEERELQEAVGALLPSLDREHSFDRRNRVDFFDAESGLAVEVKIKGGANALLRQMQRYMSRSDVTSGLVVTTSRRLAAAIPESLCGKPLAAVYLAAFM